MHQIQLSNQLYEQARQRAAEAGFDDVNAFVASVLQQELALTENLDHLFTAERLAQIDVATRQLDQGQGLTADQAEAELASRRKAWLNDHRD